MCKPNTPVTSSVHIYIMSLLNTTHDRTHLNAVSNKHYVRRCDGGCEQGGGR